MQKVLIVTHHYLDGNGGGIYATRAFVNAVSEFSDVTLLYPAKSETGHEHVSSSVRMIPVFDSRRRIRKAFDLFRGRVHRYYGILSEHLKENAYDILVFDTSIVSAGQIQMARKYCSKIVTIHHNFQPDYAMDNTSVWLRWLIVPRIRKYEKEAVLGSDLNICLTETDRQLMYSHYDCSHASRIEVSGIFEYERRRLPEIGASGRNGAFIITGNLSSVQTEKSLKSWISGYYDLLQSVPGFGSLTIAGRNPSAALSELCASRGIRLVDSPADMDEVIRGADFYVCPVDLGGGIKLRVMDGLRNGLPVLSHAVSARGYDHFVDNGILQVYEDRASFRNAVDNLIHCTKDAGWIQRQYYDCFSFDKGLKRVHDIFNSL